MRKEKCGFKSESYCLSFIRDIVNAHPEGMEAQDIHRELFKNKEFLLGLGPIDWECHKSTGRPRCKQIVNNVICNKSYNGHFSLVKVGLHNIYYPINKDTTKSEYVSLRVKRLLEKRNQSFYEGERKERKGSTSVRNQGLVEVVKAVNIEKVWNLNLRVL